MITAISNFNQNKTSVNLTKNESKIGTYRSMPVLSNSVDTFQKSENLQQKNNKVKLNFSSKNDTGSVIELFEELNKNGDLDRLGQEVEEAIKEAGGDIVSTAQDLGLRLIYP